MVVVWGCFAALDFAWLTIIAGIMNSAFNQNFLGENVHSSVT